MKVLLCGERIIIDQSLIEPLERKYDVVIPKDDTDLETVIKRMQISLIIFEITNRREKQLQILKMLKSKFTELSVIAIDDKKDVQNTIDTFNAGATDVFLTPYNIALLVERIEAIFKVTKKHSKNKNPQNTAKIVSKEVISIKDTQ